MKDETKDSFDALKTELTKTMMTVMNTCVEAERHLWMKILGIPLMISIAINIAFVMGLLKQ